MTNLVSLTITFVGIQSAVYSDPVQDQWDEYKLRHRKQYETDDEESYRLNIYLDNLKRIRDHNQQYELGTVAYKLRENKFADMLHEEFVDAHKGHWSDENALTVSDAFAPNEDDVPPSIDWREQGAVTPIKDQKRCGSCWSFAVTGALEGQLFRSTSQLVSLSEQNLIDCSDDYGNKGCRGGNLYLAFSYIKDNGINSEESYPYKARGADCRFDPDSSLTSINGITNIPSGDEEQLKAAVATVGPVATAINTKSPHFRFYSEGVYDDPGCTSGLHHLDHAVLIVGYGTTDDGVDYWIVKNSWGTTFGQEGYVLMSRNKDNQCGIATAAIFPIL